MIFCKEPLKDLHVEPSWLLCDVTAWPAHVMHEKSTDFLFLSAGSFSSSIAGPGDHWEVQDQQKENGQKGI